MLIVVLHELFLASHAIAQLAFVFCNRKYRMVHWAQNSPVLREAFPLIIHGCIMPFPLPLPMAASKLLGRVFSRQARTAQS